MNKNKGSRFIKMYSACLKRNPEYSRGFTLIELLVVIAIIGILSSVVLASLNSARTKGSDAAIKADLNNIRAQGALYYDDHAMSYGTYASGACPGTGNTTAGGSFTVFHDPTVLSAINAAAKEAGGAISGATTTIVVSKSGCYSNADGWAAAIVLKTPAAGTSAWCVDSTGSSKTVTITANTPTGAYALAGTPSAPTCNAS
jgi:prepilin-type N-terminal cleavage/methylation domain-containing protein